MSKLANSSNVSGTDKTIGYPISVVSFSSYFTAKTNMNNNQNDSKKHVAVLFQKGCQKVSEYSIKMVNLPVLVTNAFSISLKVFISSPLRILVKYAAGVGSKHRY